MDLVLLDNLPDRLNLLLAWRLSLANKHVPRLLRASGDLQELIKLQHPPLAAGPSFATLMEDRLARVVHTILVVPGSRPGISSSAASPAALCIGRDLERRVIRVGFLWWRFRGGCRRHNGGGDGWPLGQSVFNGDRSRRKLGDLGWFRRRRIVDGRVLAGGAWRDGEEFLESQDAGFAAFPA